MNRSISFRKLDGRGVRRLEEEIKKLWRRDSVQEKSASATTVTEMATEIQALPPESTLPVTPSDPWPPAVSGLSAVTGEDQNTANVIDAYITFTWTNLGAGISYALQYKRSTATDWTEISVVGGTDPTVSSRVGMLPISVEMQWRVKAVTSDGQSSEFSAIQTITTWTPEPTSTLDVDLILSMKGSAVLVQWIKGSSIHFVQSWYVYRNTTLSETGATLIATCGALQNSYIDQTVVSGKTYYYFVKVKTLLEGISDASLMKSILFIVTTSTPIIEQSAIVDAPSVDGFLAFATDIILLENCDDYTTFGTDSSVANSVIISQETILTKEGSGALKVGLWRYAKATYYEIMNSYFSLGAGLNHDILCESLVPSSTLNITALAVKVSRVGTPGDLVLSIYSDSGGNPNTLLRTVSIPVANIPSTNFDPEPKDYKYGVITSISLVSGTTYWLVVSSSGLNGLNYYKLAIENPGGYAGTCKNGNTLGSLSVNVLDLCFRVCQTGDALNKYVFATIAAKDISPKTYIRSWLRATRSGNFLSYSFGETNIGENNFSITIAIANEYEWLSANISSVPAADRNAVIKVGLKITNMDEDVILYLDDYISNEGDPKYIGRYKGKIVNVYPQLIDPEDQWEIYDDFGGDYAGNGLGPEWALGSGTTITLAILGGAVRITGDSVVAPGFSMPSLLVNITNYPTLHMRCAQYSITAGTRRMGLTGVVFGAGEPSNGIYFRHAATAAYVAVCRSGGVESIITSGVNAASGVYHKLGFIVKASGVEFFIDGVSIGTITTNIPSANLFLAFANTGLETTSGMDIDYVHMHGDR